MIRNDLRRFGAGFSLYAFTLSCEDAASSSSDTRPSAVDVAAQKAEEEEIKSPPQLPWFEGAWDGRVSLTQNTSASELDARERSKKKHSKKELKAKKSGSDESSVLQLNGSLKLKLNLRIDSERQVRGTAQLLGIESEEIQELSISGVVDEQVLRARMHSDWMRGSLTAKKAEDSLLGRVNFSETKPTWGRATVRSYRGEIELTLRP